MPLTKHSAAISAIPPPSDKPASPEVSGDAFLYRKFLHGAAGVLFPLTDALKGPGKSLTLSLALDSAFRRAKDILASIPKLVHPCPEAPISLAVDSSDSHMGSVLQQLLDGSWAPMAFFSKKLSDAERAEVLRLQWRTPRRLLFSSELLFLIFFYFGLKHFTNNTHYILIIKYFCGIFEVE